MSNTPIDAELIELLAEYGARVSLALVDGQTPTNAVVTKLLAWRDKAVQEAQLRKTQPPASSTTAFRAVPHEDWVAHYGLDPHRKPSADELESIAKSLREAAEPQP